MIKKIIFPLLFCTIFIQASRQDNHAKKAHLSTIKQPKFFNKRLDNLLYSKQYHLLEQLSISTGRVQSLDALSSNWRFFDFYYDDTSLVAVTDDILFVTFQSSPRKISKIESPYTLITDFVDITTGDINNIRSGGGFIAVTNKMNNDIDIWSSSGVHQATITNATTPIDFALTDDNSGTIFIAFDNTIKKYLVDGTFVQDYPQNVDNTSVHDVHFTTTYDGGNLFFVGNDQNNNSINIFDPSTGSSLAISTFTLSGLTTKIKSFDNKVFALREDETTADSFINIMDFTTIGSPVEGRYLAGTISHQFNDFTIAGGKVFKISIIPPSTDTKVVAWNSTDPSTFPGSPKTLDYSAKGYEITPAVSEDIVKLTGDTNYVVTLSQQGTTQFIRNYQVSDGSPNATFILPPGTISHIASSDNDKVFAIADQIVYSLSSTEIPTALSPVLTGTPEKLLAEGTFVAAMHGGTTIDIWNTSGTHQSTITTTQTIKDFMINNENGGTLYVSLANSDVYQKYDIATGSIIGTPSTITTPINGMIIAPNISLAQSIIYVLHNNSSEITALNEKTGEILGNAMTPGTVSHMASMQVVSNSLLYLSYGNNVSIYQEGASLNLSIPMTTVTTAETVTDIAVTQNGNLFAAHGQTVEGWNTIGIPLLANPITTDFPVQFLVADNNVFYSLT